MREAQVVSHPAACRTHCLLQYLASSYSLGSGLLHSGLASDTGFVLQTAGNPEYMPAP